MNIVFKISNFEGVVTLDVDFQLCKKGDKLTPEQARLLVINFY